MYRSDNGDHGDWRVSLQTGVSTRHCQGYQPVAAPHYIKLGTNKMGQLLLELETNLHEDFTITTNAFTFKNILRHNANQTHKHNK